MENNISQMYGEINMKEVIAQDKADRRKEAIHAITELMQCGKELFIYGAANTALHIYELLQKSGINAEARYVVDDKYFYADCLVPRDKLIPFSRFYEDYRRRSVLVIGFYDYLKAEAFIKKYNAEIEHIFSIQYAWVYGKPVLWNHADIADNMELYHQTLEMLCDEKSKETMIEYMRASLTGDLEKLFEKYKEDNQYFNELTECAYMGTFVDCGAYDGDTIECFLKFYQSYDKIIAFEPEPDNLKKLHLKQCNEKIKGLKIISGGAYSKNGILSFSADDSASYINDNGNLNIKVFKLDDVLAEESTSMIKMDIEGSELEALKGAAQTIKRDWPILAICVYHKAEDLITIPQFVYSISGHDTYNYYLRHHGKNLTELVFYAVPKTKRIRKVYENVECNGY